CLLIYGDHRALRSFPTRRSSDLLAQVAGRAARLGLPVEGVNALAETGIERILEQAAKLRPRIIVADSVQTLWTESLTAAPGSVRSEEHTSELQSRENLVCRLLLE